MFSDFKDETRGLVAERQTPPSAALRSCGNFREFKSKARIALSDTTLVQKVSGLRRGVVAVLSFNLSALAWAGPDVQFNLWSVSPEGTVAESGVEYDIRDDLSMQDDTTGAIELRWLGAFARFQPLEFRGESQITSTATILGIPLISTTESVGSRVDIDEWSAGWRPFSLLGLKLGAAVKHIEGTLDARIGDAVEAYSIDETFPLIAAEFSVPLGFLGLSAGGEGMWVSYDDDTVYEWQIQMRIGGEGPHASLGYRLQRYDITDGNEALDATLDGVFAQLGWLF